MVTLDMGISAVNAFKMTSTLGLQVQHAAVLQVKLEIGRFGVDFAVDFPFPGFREEFMGFRGDDTRNFSGCFSVFKGIQ